jgi:hypothetical protein
MSSKHANNREAEIIAKRDQSRDTREQLAALLKQSEYKEMKAEDLGKKLDVAPQRIRVLAAKLGYEWAPRWRKKKE